MTYDSLMTKPRRPPGGVGGVAAADPRRPYGDRSPGTGLPSAPGRSMAGVTLIELLVTLAIATILLSIAVPSFQDAAATNRVAGLTNELTAAINLARSEAVTRGRTVTVCRSADTHAAIDNDANPPEGPTCSTAAGVGWQTGWLVFVDGGVRGTVDADDIRLKVGQPSASNAIVDGGAHFSDYLSFLASGASSGNGESNGTFILCSPPKQRQVVISPTGWIRIAKTDAACP